MSEQEEHPLEEFAEEEQIEELKINITENQEEACSVPDWNTLGSKNPPQLRRDPGILASSAGPFKSNRSQTFPKIDGFLNSFFRNTPIPEAYKNPTPSQF